MKTSEHLIYSKPASAHQAFQTTLIGVPFTRVALTTRFNTYSLNVMLSGLGTLDLKTRFADRVSFQINGFLVR